MNKKGKRIVDTNRDWDKLDTLVGEYGLHDVIQALIDICSNNKRLIELHIADGDIEDSEELREECSNIKENVELLEGVYKKIKR